MLAAYLLRTGRQVPPLGSVSQVPVHNRALSEHQERSLRAAGCAVRWISSLQEIERTPCLLACDDVYFTPQAVAAVKRAARRQPGDLRAALPVSPLTEAIAAGLQGERFEADGVELRGYDLFFLRRRPGALPQAAAAAALARACRPAVLRPLVAGRKSMRTHPLFAEHGRFVMPMSSVYLCPMRHWAHVVACNLLGMTGHVLSEARRRWLSAALLPLAAAVRSGSVRPQSLLGKSYFRQPRCRVHPTAHVEGSLLGSRVRIEPHAVVRYCVIDDRAVIGPGASLQGCTVGRRAVINGGVQLNASVFGAESSIGTFFNQLSVIGRGAVICPDAGIQDFNLKGTVPVTLDGQNVRSGSRVLGAAVGDEAFLGPGIHVAAGREVPPRCVLVRSPRELIRSGDRDQLPEHVRRLDRCRGRRSDRRGAA